VLGGILLEHFWWGSVFLLAVPVMVVLVVLGPVLLPEYRDPAAGRLDLVSVVLSLVAVLVVIFGRKHIAQDGPGASAIAAIVGGVVVGGLFARRQRVLDDPMIDLRLFGNRRFSAALESTSPPSSWPSATSRSSAQYLQLVLDLSPLEAGLWSVPSAAGFIIGSQVAPRLVRTVAPATLIACGLGLAALGLVELTQVGGRSDLALLVSASVVISLGLAPVLTLTTDLIVSSAPPERAGAASGMSEARRCPPRVRRRRPGHVGDRGGGRGRGGGGDGAGAPASAPVALVGAGRPRRGRTRRCAGRVDAGAGGARHPLPCAGPVGCA
jgi:DHA2 family multidrug resistance protein-like MFS transporter